MAHKKTKILLTGGSGLLAVNWALLTRDNADVMLVLNARQIAISGVNAVQLDLGSLEQFCLLLDDFQPDYVIHAAALTSIEKCQSNPDLANYVNVQITQNVAKACSSRKIKMVHISTDHIFDGTISYVDELAIPAPINIYGETKWLAEKVVSKICRDFLILRTNFYWWGSQYRTSFSDFIINNLRESQNIHLYSDIYHTPISIFVMIKCVERLIKINASGTYHLVGNERLSKYEFGLKIAERFNLNLDQIVKCSYKKLIHKEKSHIVRPMDMSLSNKKITKLLGANLIPCIDEQINQLRQFESIIVK